MPAILNVWFAGSQAGNAIADVLFGDVNPSGKLSATFPQSVGQVPIYYAHKTTGRPQGQWFEKFRSGYLDMPNEPLYPFGYGFSYANFQYSDVQLTDTVTSAGKAITASVKVTNTGSVAGKEVVQLYIQDVVGSVTRPVKELKGFQKVLLAPGETRTISFTVTNDLLKFYHNDLSWKAEPGMFRVFIGRSSNARTFKTFELK